MKTKILIILLVALGLRLISLDQSLWLDEAIEWWAVKSFGLKELLTGYMVGDFNPPGHQVLMWFWVRIFGESEIALRMPSVIFGVGIVWWVYRIANLLRSDLGVHQGQTFRLTFVELAAGMAAVNGLMVYYSQEARMYAMAAFFVSGAMYWFMKMNKTNKTDKTNGTDYVIYCLFLAAALYSHYLTWLLLPFVAIWGLRYALPVLLTVPWLPILAKQLEVGMSAAGNPVWASLSQTNLKNLTLVVVKFVTGRVPWPEAIGGQAAVGGIVLAFWAVVIIGGIRVIREIGGIRGIRGIRRTIEAIIIFWALGPVVLGGLIGLIIPVFTYFRFLFVVPAVMVLAGVGASRWGWWGRWGTLGILGVFSLVYLFRPEFHREDWRGAVAELHRQDEAATVIIHPAVRPPFDYYDQRSEVGGRRSVVVSSQETEFRVQSLDSLWYIPYAQPIFDPGDLTRKFLRDEGYARIYEKHFRGVTLEKWENSALMALSGI